MLYVNLFLLLMLLFGLIIVSIPLVKHHAAPLTWVMTLLIFPALSFSLYFFSSDQKGLDRWLNGGAQHYALMNKIDHLGGLDGIIRAINLRLEKNPDDFEGWMILGKLYLSMQQYPQAEKALLHAERLQPGSKKIAELMRLLPTAQ